MFRDALTLTSRFRKPGLFVTMIANPKWIEIQQHLPICAKLNRHGGSCFHHHHQKLIDLIENDQIF